MGEPHEELERWWCETRCDLVRTNQAAKSVQELERRYTLPSDFRAYLLSSSLSKDVDDDGMMSWWAIGRIRNIDEEYNGRSDFLETELNRNHYLFFADHAIWCSAWCICCKIGESFGKIAIIGGNPDRFIADSFTDLVRKYLKNPEKFPNEQYGGAKVPLGG